MPAYFIADIEITDPAAFACYRELADSSMDKFGGRYLVRGGPTQPLEGDWFPNRVVVLEFPDMAAARGWYDSSEYQAACKIRRQASTGKAVLVEGVITA